MPRAADRKKRARAAASPKSRKAGASESGPVAGSKPGASAAAHANAAVAGFQMLDLKRLIRLVQRTGIGELEINSGGRSVRISASAANSGHVMVPAGTRAMDAAATSASPAPAPAAPAPPPEPAANQKAVVSPMVGTFYRAPAPDADPFVEVGDVIEVGQTVCIIEAMKLMNEIEAETKGRVAKILIENAQPVEFGQKLFLIDPL
jgi:oxaloacetate decarboxylase alpha subunit